MNGLKPWLHIDRVFMTAYGRRYASKSVAAKRLPNLISFICRLRKAIMTFCMQSSGYCCFYQLHQNPPFLGFKWRL